LRNSSSAHNQQDLFIRAQAEYLKGHWVEAQSLLEQLLRDDPEDVESHLLLASVFRRSRRIELARKQLHRLGGFPGRAKWQFEIQRELDLLQQRVAPDVAPDA
jgi:cytochrome c-type biogenesis protein CcmH/NrfG